jgi:hypothetical protein
MIRLYEARTENTIVVAYYSLCSKLYDIPTLESNNFMFDQNYKEGYKNLYY